MCLDVPARRDSSPLSLHEVLRVGRRSGAGLGGALARAAVAAFPAVDPACAVDELFDRVASVPSGLRSSQTGAPAAADAPPQMLPLSPLQVHGYPAYYHQPGAAPAPARGGDPNNT